ncbi:MAG: RrF2 family transcriptional regulator [Minwuia sp.]|uniref:RrF2 family transcriptional regulator n=1 Tax=Minwuia sp. TaxID=2493630 RepID=UPI003A88AE93
MLRLPRKTLYALDAVLDVAYNARPDPVQSKDITARQNIPPRYLEQAMQQLVRAGILKGVRGPRGGYTLARERRRISVADIVSVISIDDEADDAGSDLGLEVVRPLWSEIQLEIMERLSQITLEDLCRRAENAGVEKAGARTRDFTI